MTPADVTSTTANRAVANALWPKLKHDRWRRHVQRRDLASNGAHPGYRSVGTGSIPNAPRALDNDVITDQRYIRATVWADEWPGGTNLLVELEQTTYTRTLESLDDDTRGEYLHALTLATCRAPFERDTNRHGTLTLRRNKNDPTITPAAALALETIAAAADVRTVDQHTVDDALLTDEDVHLASASRLWDQLEAGTGTGIPSVLAL